jgi:diphthamide synthase (EF-2-diphthine--ammonia ligase)
VAGLLTTFNGAADRVAMHAVRRALVRAQADAAALPLTEVALPWPCTNEEYEARLGAAVREATADGFTHVAFGDLFLEDVRRYREERLAGSGLTPLFPLWGRPTRALADEMLRGGLRATLSCVDTRQLAGSFAGREYDAALVAELPPEVDPCGERGEFHTFAWAGPMFAAPLPVAAGERVERDGFVFVDLTTCGTTL